MRSKNFIEENIVKVTILPSLQIFILENTTANFNKYERIIWELFKTQNPYLDKNLEVQWNLGIFILEKLSVQGMLQPQLYSYKFTEAVFRTSILYNICGESFLLTSTPIILAYTSNTHLVVLKQYSRIKVNWMGS